MSSPAIVIVGAGVLGLSTAFSLTRRGHAVTV
ncbi:FAD-dependent oxidoreductase, partial [Acinetobacter baumannii]